MINIKNKKAASAVMIFAGALMSIAAILTIMDGSSITNVEIGAVELIAGIILVGVGIYGFIKNS